MCWGSNGHWKAQLVAEDLLLARHHLWCCGGLVDRGLRGTSRHTRPSQQAKVPAKNSLLRY